MRLGASYVECIHFGETLLIAREELLVCSIFEDLILRFSQLGEASRLLCLLED